MNYSSLSLPDKSKLISEYLKEDYPTVRTPLFHRNAFEFLISVMLSPQTNDETTNKVTRVLFEKYTSPEALANADPADVAQIIRIVNYHKTKAERVIGAAKQLLEKFNGKVPHTMAELTSIPGVGRKVANVTINDWYATSADQNPPYESEKDQDPNQYNSIERGLVAPTGFVVDTHILRVSAALGLTKQKSPDKVEQDMMRVFPVEEWMTSSLRMIFHGRQVFQAKNPQFANFPKWKEVYQSLGY